MNECYLTFAPWKMEFDGSKNSELAGAGVIITDPGGNKYEYSFKLDFESTNNQSEYEALMSRPDFS